MGARAIPLGLRRLGLRLRCQLVDLRVLRGELALVLAAQPVALGVRDLQLRLDRRALLLPARQLLPQPVELRRLLLDPRLPLVLRRERPPSSQCGSVRPER